VHLIQNQYIFNFECLKTAELGRLHANQRGPENSMIIEVGYGLLLNFSAKSSMGISANTSFTHIQ